MLQESIRAIRDHLVTSLVLEHRTREKCRPRDTMKLQGDHRTDLRILGQHLDRSPETNSSVLLPLYRLWLTAEDS